MTAFSRRTSLTLIVLAVLVPAVLLCGSAPAQTATTAVVSPGTLNFQTLVRQTSPPQRVSLTNTGESEITVSSISITGDFALPINHCAEAVKPGTHCDVYVTYSPQALETETGTLTFTDNASNTPQTVSLTGTGVSMAGTALKITASPKQIYAGQTITFTVTVISLGGGVIPNGEQVAFYSRGGNGFATLQNGVAILTIGLHGASARTVVMKASYPGDQTFYGSYGAVQVKVLKYDTTTTLTSSPNPSVFGYPVTYTATTTADGPVAANGLTELYLPGLPGFLSTEATDNQLEGVGTAGASAEYRGDGYTYPSFTMAEHMVVPAATTTIILSSKNHPIAQGRPVTFRTIVKTPAPNVVAVDGSVTFTSGTTTLGTVQLKDSRGEITVSSLPVGQNTITATYNPSGDFTGSSGSLVQIVN
jgi:hypothetical protein